MQGRWRVYVVNGDILVELLWSVVMAVEEKGGMVVTYPCDDKYNNIQSNDTMIMTYLVWKLSILKT